MSVGARRPGRRLRSAILAGGLAFLGQTGAQGQEAPRYGISAPAFSSTMTALPVLLEDDAARAILARHAPGLLVAPNLPRGRNLTLADVQPVVGNRVLSAAVLAAIDADLALLPRSPAARKQAGDAIAAIDAARLDPAAPWITHPSAFLADFERAPVALDFRRAVRLTSRPRSVAVRVSADQRFILYVNGVRVAAGPARGDLAHYRYETIDLAPHLRAGENVLAARVWSDGKFAPVATISSGHSGFMLKAEDAAFAAALDTGPGWQVRVDGSRSVGSARAQISQQVGGGYYAAGAPERLDGARIDARWTVPGDAGPDWQPAVAAVTGGDRARTLVADALPQMRYAAVPSGAVVRASGIAAGGFPRRAVTVPANSEATLLVDAGRVLAGYPALVTSGGRGAQVTVTYTESLYDPVRRTARGGAVRFADRGRVEDGRALGLTDTFLPAGADGTRFEPYWWRAWRLAEIRVKTGDAPLTLDRFETHETGYPFERRAWFDSSDAGLNEIWRIGWRTALVDAHETYHDTPYWEQLQYVGDTRLQALISYDVAGDARLAVQALDAFDRSRVIDGLPQSSWPISSANPVPPFALLWIGMLHDHWLRQPDTAPIVRNLAGVRAVLDWYRPYAGADGIVRGSPGWLFIDWRPGLDGGGPGNRSGEGQDNCVISLLRLGALRDAADIERAVGDPARAADHAAAAAVATRGIQDRCWDEGRGLYADTPAKTAFSQHANVLAILHDVAPAERRAAILDRITVPGHGIDAPPGITGTTYYFSYYLAQALDHAGLADRYIALLTTWRDLLKQHFTTWPEEPDPSRSDSHAWSAHPTSGLLNHVAGIQPAAPGFARVRIAPHLGALTSLSAGMAVPTGLVRADYRVAGGRLRATIALPPGLAGTFVYGGTERPLKAGRNRIDMAAR